MKEPNCPNCHKSEFDLGKIFLKDDKDDSAVKDTEQGHPIDVIQCVSCGAIISVDPHYWEGLTY